MLSSEELAQWRTRLEAERDRLSAQIEEVEGLLSSSDEDNQDDFAGNHIGDGASDLFERDRLLEQVETARDNMRRVEHALARVNDGSYGISEVSGKPIPTERLEALPTATTLIDEPAPEL